MVSVRDIACAFRGRAALALEARLAKPLRQIEGRLPAGAGPSSICPSPVAGEGRHTGPRGVPGHPGTILDAPVVRLPA